MDGFLRANSSAGGTLAPSPTNLFLADEVASTCPLITPSPPTNDLINPLPEPPEPPAFIIGEELASKLQSVKDVDHKVDSGSSSSSTTAEPVCSQLLNHHHHYQHITKNEESGDQEANGKIQPMQLTFRNPPDDYDFMKWNWPLIRKISTWTFMAGLIAMTALVITMISTLPKTCNPRTQWYQGQVFYEIFPASFHDTDKDGIGDLTGIAYYAKYLQDMGVGAVRLNSIFHSQHYPEDYNNLTTLLEIDPKLGTLNHFKVLVDSLHLRNISLVLDLPLFPFVQKLNSHKVQEFNDSDANLDNLVLEIPRPENPNTDEVTEAILFWLQYDVDGFYLQGLEHFIDEPSFPYSLRRWKKLLGPDRCLIVSDKVYKQMPTIWMNTLLLNVDLIDVKFKVEDGVASIRDQLNAIQNSTLFSKPSMPWIHWSIGDLRSARLANRLNPGNATLGATLLQLMLPGTPSIFYGDEIGLRQLEDIYDDSPEVSHLRHLGPMVWSDIYGSKSFTEPGIHPWIEGQQSHSSLKQAELIGKMIKLRRQSPSIYVNSVVKDGENKANSEVKYSQGNLLVIQRYYPRRKAFVIVSNLGKKPERADLSKLLYSGEVLVGPRADSKSESISFKDISLWPGESVVIVLD